MTIKANARSILRKSWWFILIVAVNALFWRFLFAGSTISGNVTFEGVPIPRGKVIFFPADRPWHGDFPYDPKLATYIEKGKYHLSGLAPGEYRVVINASIVSETGGGSFISVDVKDRQHTLDIDLHTRPKQTVTEPKEPGKALPSAPNQSVNKGGAR